VAEALRCGTTESHAGTSFDRLHAAGAISSRSAQRLNELRRVRDELQHTYVPHLRAKLLHRAVEALLAELDRFVDRYETWAKRVGLLS
jgi:uncharacterized protein YutE (UPF0331/DUF86 family)